ncbi:ethanolamine utilization protein EutH [Caldanaerobius polysaccharolyticus]|uniref:ethanolamine utilization protein EutH n=1 Tax=Caldanaerobius polysaccharolyticus TaxID=44256 RepID=UPI000478F8B9|nr:ethanolamine utilization protein EutH [Caldanaerobius polysaccharolyticus]
MGNVVLYLIGVFFAIGGLDYAIGSPLGLGKKFEEGIKAMGAVGLGMIGIYSISPAISQVLLIAITPVSKVFGVDPSAIAASFLAVDMGGYQIARSLAFDEKMGLFSGVVVASNLGAAISFSIPVAMGMISRDEQRYFSKGVMIGVIAIPIGCFAAGLWYGLNPLKLLKDMLPILVISAFIGIGLSLIPDVLLGCFDAFGKVIIGLSTAGLLAQGGYSVFGINLGFEVIPLQQVMSVVGKIAFILGGAYPMLAVLEKFFGSFLKKIGNRYGIDSSSVISLLGNLATNLLVFGNFKNMNAKGKVVCSAFAISGAFVFGGQMGFVSSVAPSMLVPFMVSKFVAGLFGLMLALRLWDR